MTKKKAVVYVKDGERKPVVHHVTTCACRKHFWCEFLKREGFHEETSPAYAIVKIVIPGDLQRCVETISIECLPSQALCLGNMEMNNAEIITRFDFIHAIVEATHEELKRRNKNDA